MIAQVLPPLLFTNATLEIPLIFSAKPAPSDTQVTWTVTPTANDSAHLPPTVVWFGAQSPGLAASGVEPMSSPHTFHAALYVSNVTSNVSVVVRVENRLGAVSKTFYVAVSPVSDQLVSDQRVVVVAVSKLLTGGEYFRILLVLVLPRKET